MLWLLGYAWSLAPSQEHGTVTQYLTLIDNVRYIYTLRLADAAWAEFRHARGPRACRARRVCQNRALPSSQGHAKHNPYLQRPGLALWRSLAAGLPRRRELVDGPGDRPFFLKALWNEKQPTARAITGLNICRYAPAGRALRRTHLSRVSFQRCLEPKFDQAPRRAQDRPK